jgi:hypothetical protein
MLSETFVSFSLGKWIGERTGMRQSDLVYFVIGFVVLNVLLLVPFVGALISLIAKSLGFCAIVYAARKLAALGQANEV